MNDYLIYYIVIGTVVTLVIFINMGMSHSNSVSTSRSHIPPWPIPPPPPIVKQNYTGYKIILNRGRGKDRILKFLSDDELGYIITGDDKLDEIMNYHLNNGRDIFKCQQDLIDAGYESLANI